MLKKRFFWLIMAALLLLGGVSAPVFGEVQEASAGLAPLPEGGQLQALEVQQQAEELLAYAYDATSSSIVNLGIPGGAIGVISNDGDSFMSAGDFVGDQLYMVHYFSHGLYRIDTATGAKTLAGTISGISGSPSGFAYDVKNDTAYLISTDISYSYLYRINLDNAGVTLVGSSPYAMIGIASDTEGNLYGLDIVTDALYSISTANGEAALIGSTGVDLNYAQDIGYDRDNGKLYGTLYDNSTYNGGLYELNTATGQATLLQVFGDELDALAIPYTASQLEVRVTPDIVQYSDLVDLEAALPEGYLPDVVKKVEFRIGGRTVGWSRVDEFGIARLPHVRILLAPEGDGGITAQQLGASYDALAILYLQSDGQLEELGAVCHEDGFYWVPDLSGMAVLEVVREELGVRSIGMPLAFANRSFLLAGLVYDKDWMTASLKGVAVQVDVVNKGGATVYTAVAEANGLGSVFFQSPRLARGFYAVNLTVLGNGYYEGGAATSSLLYVR